MARIQVWDPVREAVTLRDAMDRLFEQSLVRLPRQNGGSSHYVPRADAWESDEEVVLEIALPGVGADDVEITLEEDCVAISGEYRPRDDERSWVMRERASGPFERRFDIRVPIDADKVGASFQQGVLVLRLPKTEGSKPRKIAVKPE